MIEFAFSTDDNYAVHLATVVTSIFEAHRNLNARFHVLDCGISDERRAALAALFDGTASEIEFHPIKEELTLGASTPSYISSATLARLLLPSILKDVDRILYLDIDIVVVSDLTELWETPLYGNIAGMVESYWTKYKTYKKKIGLRVDDPYFNAGVIVFDLKAMRDEAISDKFLSYFDESKSWIEFADQDVINHCLVGRIKPLSPRWNVPTGVTGWLPGDTITINQALNQEALEKPAIAHFTGSRKAWHRDCDHPLAAKFRRVETRTKWPDRAGSFSPSDAPLVSVIMAVHNDDEYLRDSVSSILNQTYSNLEFIVINDASTDRTRDILSYFASEDGRLAIIDNEHQLGLAASLNVALLRASGKYIARMDSDDISHPDRIHQQVEFMEAKEDIAVLGTQVNVIRPFIWEKKEYSYPIFERDAEIRVNFLKRPGIIHPTVMFRASFLKEHGIQYDPQFIRSQDYELWVRIAFKHGGKFHNLQTPLLSYRVKGGDRSSNVAIQERFKAKIHAEILGSLGIGSRPRLQYHALWASNKLHRSKSLKIKDKKLVEHKLKIMEANNEKRLFEKEVLRKALFDGMKRELYYSYRNGMSAWRTYTRSKVKRYLRIGAKDEKIFWRRCILWETWNTAKAIPVLGFLIFICIAVANPRILFKMAK